MTKTYDATVMKLDQQPLFTLVGLEGEALKEMVESYKPKSGWLIPQAQAYLSKELQLKRNEQGLISPTLVIKELSKGKSEGQKNWIKGLLIYLNYSPRGSILGKMNSPQIQCPYTSSLVPLILYTFKRDRSVGYEEWDWNDPFMQYFVDKDLLDAVLSNWYDEYSAAELLDFRSQVCIQKSGIKEGQVLNPTSVSKKSTLKQENAVYFNNLPRLAQHMLLQIHVAHPSIRVPAMILRPDFTIPDALITEEIVAKVKEEPKYIEPKQPMKGALDW